MRKLFLSLAALCGCALLSAIEYSAADLMKNVSTPLFQNRTAMNQDVVKTATAYLDTVEAKTDARNSTCSATGLLRMIRRPRGSDARRTQKIRGLPDRKNDV